MLVNCVPLVNMRTYNNLSVVKIALRVNTRMLKAWQSVSFVRLEDIYQHQLVVLDLVHVVNRMNTLIVKYARLVNTKMKSVQVLVKLAELENTNRHQGVFVQMVTIRGNDIWKTNILAQIQKLTLRFYQLQGTWPQPWHNVQITVQIV